VVQFAHPSNLEDHASNGGRRHYQALGNGRHGEGARGLGSDTERSLEMGETMQRILIGLALTLVTPPAWAQTEVEQVEAMAITIANDCAAHKDDPQVCEQMAKFLVDKGYKQYEQKNLNDEAARIYRAALKIDPTNDAAKKGLIRLGATP
jgi:hypothetical protein